MKSNLPAANSAFVGAQKLRKVRYREPGRSALSSNLVADAVTGWPPIPAEELDGSGDVAKVRQPSIGFPGAVGGAGNADLRCGLSLFEAALPPDIPNRRAERSFGHSHALVAPATRRNAGN